MELTYNNKDEMIYPVFLDDDSILILGKNKQYFYKIIGNTIKIMQFQEIFGSDFDKKIKINYPKSVEEVQQMQQLINFLVSRFAHLNNTEMEDLLNILIEWATSIEITNEKILKAKLCNT